MRTIDVEVLVVGIGPSGLAAAGFLSKYDVNVLAISKYAAPAPTPRATVANARSIEIYRDLGCEKEVQAVGVPLPKIYNNVFATSFAGLEIGRYKSYGVPPERQSDYALASPCSGWNVPQHRLEPVLLKTARGYGADVRYSNEMLHIEQTADEVRARILDKDSGEEYDVRARYVVAADGGRSPTAEIFGVEFQGEEAYGDIVSMWVEADLEKYTAYRPGLIYSILQPGRHQFGGGWLCVRCWDEWLVSVAGATSETPESELLERAYKTIGDPDVKIRIKQTYSWKVNHLYACEYRKGRVFLAGDAAHRHPPSGGLGANTSMQDSFNLAWKLAYVLKGKAGDGLLDSYHQERQPVGRHVVERANASLRNQRTVTKALSLQGLKEKELDKGWQILENFFADTPEAAERRANFSEAIKLGNYRSNAIGVELGQRYTSCAVVSDGTPFPEYTRDPDLYYHRTTHPGAYVPHAWVLQGKKQISMIDITGKGRFSLIIGLSGKGWASAAAKASAELGIDIAILSIGPNCEYNDIYAEWAGVREVSEQGALLVRPDRHIAWRSAGGVDSPDKVLLAALRQVLAR